MPDFKRLQIVFAAVLIGGLGESVARSGEPTELSITVGIKEWASTWTSWMPQGVQFGTSVVDVIDPVTSSTKFAPTPQLSVVYGRTLLSASYLTATSYPVKGTLHSGTVGSRQEFDGSTGFYLLSGLAFTAGYKGISQNFGTGTYKWTGPTAGITASAPLESNWALYGSLSYGWFQLKTPVGSADYNGKRSFNASYSVGEFGIAYAIGVKHIFDSMRVTAGYRSQQLKTMKYALHAADGSQRFNVTDETLGLTLGISATF